MSDPILTPPPRRPAPPELRQRIQPQLEAARRPRRRPWAIVVPVAAAGLLVSGALGARSLTGDTDAVPAATPTASAGPARPPSPSPTPTPTSTPSATPSAKPVPATLPSRVMTKAEIKADLARCTAPDTTPGAQPLPRRGRWRTQLAVVVPVVEYPAGAAKSVRMLIAYDEVGTQECVDGRADTWSSGPPAEARLDQRGPALILTSSGGGIECNSADRTGRIETGTAYRVPDRVERVRVTLRSDGAVARVVDLLPAGGQSAVLARWSGAAAWAETDASVQMLDRAGRTVPIANDAGRAASRDAWGRGTNCAEVTERRKPPVVRRPASDAAGVTACRREISGYLGESGASFDVTDAEAVVSVTTSALWGVVLSDGRRFVGCSRFPTTEISDVRSGRGSATSKSTFSWAHNPIGEQGETLWAAGRLPGVESITYRLPDGQQVPATIGSGGHWLVMARTATAFDTEQNVSDWAPVVVEVTVKGTTTTHRIPWTEESGCNQVSHGC